MQIRVILCSRALLAGCATRTGGHRDPGLLPTLAVKPVPTMYEIKMP